MASELIITLIDFVQLLVELIYKPFGSFLMRFLVEVIVPLGWPIALVGIFATFRQQIGELIPRTETVGPTGASFAAMRQEINTETQVDLTNQLSEPFDDPILNPWYELVEKAVENITPREEADLMKSLKVALAMALRKADFEMLARVVWGTQISILKRLRDDPSNPKTEDELNDQFKEHMERSDNTAFVRFVDWMAILVDHRLVQYDAGKFEITPVGVLFLDFLYARKIDESRMW